MKDLSPEAFLTATFILAIAAVLCTLIYYCAQVIAVVLCILIAVLAVKLAAEAFEL